MSTLILAQFNRTLETIVETDASNRAIVGILSQYHVVNRTKELHPIKYHAKTLTASQHNWHIHDKKLFAIMYYLREWQDWLVSCYECV